MISRDKRNRLWVSLALLTIIITWTVVDYRGDGHISFSKKSGYYDSAFNLKILGGGE